MTDDDLQVVAQLRERQLLREFDRASEIADRLRAQLAVVERVRQDLVVQMRKLVDDTDTGEVGDGATG